MRQSAKYQKPGRWPGCRSRSAKIAEQSWGTASHGSISHGQLLWCGTLARVGAVSRVLQRAFFIPKSISPGCFPSLLLPTLHAVPSSHFFCTLFIPNSFPSFPKLLVFHSTSTLLPTSFSPSCLLLALSEKNYKWMNVK